MIWKIATLFLFFNLFFFAETIVRGLAYNFSEQARLYSFHKPIATNLLIAIEQYHRTHL